MFASLSEVLRTFHVEAKCRCLSKAEIYFRDKGAGQVFWKIRRSTLKEAKSNKSLRIWYEVNDGVEGYHDIQFSET